MTEQNNSYKVHHGGLMRCCLHSLDLDIQKRIEESDALVCVEDEIIKCRYCREEMIYKDKTWRWNGSKLGERLSEQI